MRTGNIMILGLIKKHVRCRSSTAADSPWVEDMLGYVRKVESARDRERVNGSAGGKARSAAPAWTLGDTVQVIGTLGMGGTAAGGARAGGGGAGGMSSVSTATEPVQWEYSAKTVAVIAEYKNR